MRTSWASHCVRALPLLRTVLLGAVVASCQSGGSSDCDEASAECGQQQQECADTIPAGSTLSETCCEEWGPDACGAGLFCAAFDGRTISTCYPLRSRTAMSECAANEHCMSGECNVAAGRCKSLHSESCSAEVGCVQSADGVVCDRRAQRPTCRSVGSYGGSGDQLCTTDAHCSSERVCQADYCLSIGGQRCSIGADCQSGVCTSGTCSARVGEPCDSSASEWEEDEGTCADVNAECVSCHSSAAHCANESEGRSECLCDVGDYEYAVRASCPYNRY